MAHFAEINESNIVVRVIAVADSDCGGGQYPQSDPIGAEFCNRLLGGVWKQTSYNNNFRKQYAGVGYRFDAENDRFIQPQPFPSWQLDDNGDWQAPVPYPTEGNYYWDELAQSWVEADWWPNPEVI
jgi:hypothetical protein